MNVTTPWIEDENTANEMRKSRRLFSLGSVRREMNLTSALASGSCPIDGQNIIAIHRKNGTCPVAVPTHVDFALKGSALTS